MESFIVVKSYVMWAIVHYRCEVFLDRSVMQQAESESELWVHFLSPCMFLVMRCDGVFLFS